MISPEIAQDLVSVVVPTRGRPGLLVSAVNSALLQTHPAIEIIVVIDGQDPTSVVALQEMNDDRIKWHVNEVPLGAPAARNKGKQVAHNSSLERDAMNSSDRVEHLEWQNLSASTFSVAPAFVPARGIRKLPPFS